MAVAELLISDTLRQRVLLGTAPVLSLVISVFAIVAYYPPEQPGIFLAGIVIAYVLYRIFVVFNWIRRFAGAMYIVFEVVLLVMVLSTFRSHSVFVVNTVLAGIALLLMEAVRRELKKYHGEGG